MNPNPYANFRKPVSDKFKSTQIWNELVYAFCVGMQAKRHRKKFKYYDDCFAAKTAVDWLHHHLVQTDHFKKHQVSR